MKNQTDFRKTVETGRCDLCLSSCPLAESVQQLAMSG